MNIKLDPRSRTIGRIIATLVAIVPAFFLSLFLRLFSIPWIISNTIWIIIYLYYFVYYSTAYLNQFSLQIDQEFLTTQRGVIYQTQQRVPRENIQFVVQTAGPLGKLFGTTTLRFMLAGGIVVLPGISQKDANDLVVYLNLPVECSEKH